MRAELHPDAEKFREYLGFDKSANTAYNYSRNVSKFLVWVNKSTDELTPIDITDWFRKLQEEGYSRRTICRFGHALRSFFDIMEMPELKRRTPIMEYESKDPLWLEKEVVMRLIAEIPVLCVGYDLALRVGEVESLRRSAFNPTNGNIEVKRLKHKGRRNSYILTLSDWCLDILNEYLGALPDGNDVMFPMSVHLIQRIFNDRAHTLGLEGYTFHSLRHSRVTHIALAELDEKGVVDELSLSKFAGHLRVETTRMYVHLANRHIAFKS